MPYSTSVPMIRRMAQAYELRARAVAASGAIRVTAGLALASVAAVTTTTDSTGPSALSTVHEDCLLLVAHQLTWPSATAGALTRTSVPLDWYLPQASFARAAVTISSAFPS